MSAISKICQTSNKRWKTFTFTKGVGNNLFALRKI